MDSAEVPENKNPFDVLAGLQADVQHLGEAISALDTKIEQEFGALRAEMRSEFAETKAMLRSFCQGTKI